MNSLPKPGFSVIEVLESLSNCSEKVMKNKISDNMPHLILCEKFYELHAKDSSWVNIKKSEGAGTFSKDEMISLYENNFVVKTTGSPAPAALYNKIKNSGRRYICPYCGVNIADTVDHFLPKAFYNQYTITPLNLVPACVKCQGNKEASDYTKSGVQILHPYFDTLDKERWIFARVIEDCPPGVDYYIKKPTSMSDEIYFQRVKEHYTVLKLLPLYYRNLNSELLDILPMLKKLYDKGEINKNGKMEVVSFLTQESELHKTKSVNNYKYAMYEALLNSSWFLDKYLKRSAEQIKSDVDSPT